MVGGPCDFSVSPRSKSFFFLFLGTFIRLGGLLRQVLGLGFGPGLDNFQKSTKLAIAISNKHDIIPNYFSANILQLCVY